jgi:hypothetical protein
MRRSPVSELFATARIVDVIVGFMLLELMVLIIVRKKSGKGIATLDLAASLAAGLSLLMALRAALLHDSWMTMAAWLLLALFAHVADLARRWR